MSHEPHAMAAIFGLPAALILGLAAALLVAAAAGGVAVRRKRSVRPGGSAWEQAAKELGIDLVSDMSSLGPVASGTVNEHAVSMAPFTATGFADDAQTMYTVTYESPEAPEFSLTGRTAESEIPILDTGNPKFDAVVAVNTEHPALLSRFLTPQRRGAILRLLTYWPEAVITHHNTRLMTTGIEGDVQQLVDSICHLVAAAEIFDQPSDHGSAKADDVHTSEAPRPAKIGDAPVEDQRGILTDVRVDEVSVFRNLFANELDSAAIASKFDQIYRGRLVTWSGEVVRVAAQNDEDKQRITAFVGSASGQDVASGRVVVITNVDAEPKLRQGDVVTFTGKLANLNVDQRLFHLT